MKTEHVDWLRINVPGKPAVLAPRDWWAWVLHCNGFSTKHIAQELFIPRGYVKWACAKVRQDWLTYLDLLDPITWN